MEWDCLIRENVLTKRIQNGISYITRDILNSTADNNNYSLIDGKAGIAIFLNHLTLHENNKEYNYIAKQHIKKAADAIANSPMSYYLANGVSGILWALTYLNNLNFLELRIGDVIGEGIDKFLLNSSLRDLKKGRYDYLYGGLGVIIYFLERGDDDERYAGYLSELVNGLKEASQNFPEGLWMLDSLSAVSHKKYNLGLAHGISSIIIILSKLIKRGILTDVTIELLEKCVCWVLEKKRKNIGNGIFPLVFPEDTNLLNRIAWCNGDLGVAMALLQAGLVTGSGLWQEQATEIALHTADRRQPLAGAVDAGFCHGTAGIAHTFNRLFRHTGNRNFREIALYWYKETMDMFEKQDKFEFFIEGKKGRSKFHKEDGILVGSAGVGLCLLSAMSSSEPKWDRCFLLS